MSPWILGGREGDQGLGLTDKACTSLHQARERLQWLPGEQQWPGVKEGVNASSCLSELQKLRVAEKQQVREWQWGCNTSQRHAAS